MNAKKIMGAVLVALLAAALFVGAGAAETEDMGTVFVYEVVDPSLDGTWTNGNAVVTISNGVVAAGANFVAGTYTKGDYSLYVTYPTASYFATAGSTTYIVENIVYLNDVVTITVSPASANMTIDDVYVYYENKAPFKATAGQNTGEYIIDADRIGSYKVVAHFADGTNHFVSGTPDTYKYDTVNALTFKVVKDDAVAVTASADKVLIGETFTITVTGVAGQTIGFEDDSNGHLLYQENAAQNTGISSVTLGNTGVATIYVTVATGTEAGDYEITVTELDANSDKTDNDASVDIEVIEGEITAKAEKDSYYIGSTIKLSGTTTVGDELYLYIKGTNYKFEPLSVDVEEDNLEKTWTAEIKAADIPSKTDAGTYTIYVATVGGQSDVKDIGTYTTVGVNLIQPFISITSAPEVVIQNEQFEIKGVAEATGDVKYYIFGTNFFLPGQANVKDGVFTIKATLYSEDEVPQSGKVAEPGQYFLVIQHKMYDGLYNIRADADGNFWLNATTTDANGKAVYALGEILFNVDDRQTANAAQALCDALETENIDDMYVKASFIVAAPTSVINPIPAEIAKGTKLTVSGTTTGAVGELVTVDMLSTAFAAVPKDTVGSASFISLTTKVQEDGTWEVTFDTSNLNVDEYTISAAVGSLSKTTTKVNVVEKAPVTPEQPDTPVTPEQPEQPEQPEAPATPGFGALAALAGLGAVAVLLLRRE